ncbi:MAG: hypothetical protein AAF657_07460 [Acidobacteriota bacterium]
MASQAPGLGVLNRLNPRLELTPEEGDRRGYLALSILIIIPPIAGFGLVDWMHGRAAEALMTLSMVAALATTLILLAFWHRTWIFFRLALLCAVALVGLQIATGRSGGFGFLWLYALPVVVFFLFGTREGSIWVLTSGFAVALLFFGDFGFHDYPLPVGIRFLIAYGIVAILAYGIEASRRRHYEALLTEKQSLEEAMQQLQTLRGLLPICTACKSVRDDHGFWNQIEGYLAQHSQAEFRSSLCPDCSTAQAEPPT